MQINIITLFNRLADDVDLDPFTRKYCTSRIYSEGIQFLTVTLPKLSKAVLASLEAGYFIRPSCFAWKGKSLRFFTKFLNRIFDRGGKVLAQVDPLAIYQVRQLCEYFYKLSLDFKESQLAEAAVNFKKIDDDLIAQPTDRAYVDQLRKDFETHYRPIVSAAPCDVFRHSRPRPGPGTYSRHKEWSQLSGDPWFFRKEKDTSYKNEYHAHAGFFKPYENAPSPEVDSTDPDYSEVLFVPKDSRGPRVIVREPYSRLLGQMAFNSFLSSKLEYLSRNRINFRDQQVNRELARSSSITRKWATIDLKDASDSVDNSIIRHIFRNSPSCMFFVLNRTKYARLPGSDDLHRLNKLAGMGSGLTFPCMSLLIHLTITRAFVSHLRIPYRRARLYTYVYGDDIIVPAHLYNVAVRALERVKLKVNQTKSFRHSHFRESCGGDFFDGQDVAPVRLKLSGSALSTKGFELTCSGDLRYLAIERHCRELVRNGLNALAELLYKSLERYIGKLPFVSGASPILGRYTILTPKYEVSDTGMYETIRCIMPVPKKREIDRNPYVFLGRFLSRSSDDDSLRYLDCDPGSAYDMVAEPYTIKYQRIRVSAFRLMS